MCFVYLFSDRRLVQYRVSLGVAVLLLMLSGCLNRQLNAPLSPITDVAPVLNTGLDNITSFDVAVDRDDVHLIVAGALMRDTKHIKVHYMHSADGGRHWSAPVEMGTSVAAPIAARGNDIQLAVSGDHRLAVWQAQGELPNMGPMVSVYSTDGGKTWQAGSNPAVNMSGDQAHLDLAADQQGVFHAVWLEDPEENGYQSLRYAQSQDFGLHWKPAQTLDSSTCSCCWNIIQVAADNALNILYRDMEPRDMALIQSQDQGASWQRLSTVGQFNWKFEGCPHIGGALAFENASKPVLHSLVWTGIEQSRGLYYLRSENKGKSWSTPYRLGNKAFHGDIAASVASAQVAAVWDEASPDGSAIFMSQPDNAGLWSNARLLSSKAALATHPRIVATPSGFLVLWTEKLPKQSGQLGVALFK